MGDMADLFIEQGMLAELDAVLSERVVCKHCGDDDFYWEKTPFGWRLFSYEDMKIHNCEEYPR